MTSEIDIGVVPFEFPSVEAARTAFRDLDAQATEHKMVVSAFSGVYDGRPMVIIGGPVGPALIRAADMVEHLGGVQAEIEPAQLMSVAARIAAAHVAGLNGRWDHGSGLRI
jgi:hypothetical protein